MLLQQEALPLVKTSLEMMIFEPEEWLSPQKVVKSLGFNPLRSLGQNFMMDKGVLRSMVEHSHLDEGDVVVEVGPGSGALTQYLLAQPVEVTCVELDRGLSEYLKVAYGPKGLQVIHGDILLKKRGLNADLLKLLEQWQSKGQRIRWISNLPYNILTPFLWNLLECPQYWASGLFLVQKEFIDRLKAMPGAVNYSPLSVVSHLYLKVGFVRNVAKGCFWPAPEVESAILSVEPLDELSALELEFIEFLKLVFSQRRKVMAKLLKSRVKDIKDKLESLGIQPDVRAESLCPEELLKVYQDCSSSFKQQS